MANDMIQETIIISAAGKFGPKVGNEYYGINDPLRPEQFETGKSYQVLMKRGKPTDKYPKGKAYISQIIGELGAPQTAPQTSPTPTKTVDSGTTVKVDYDKRDTDKNKRILVQGIVQAVVQSPVLAAIASTEKELVEVVKAVSKNLIQFVLDESK